MCKLFSITNMEHVKVTPHFLKVVRDAVCAKSDKDGFGYAIVDELNQLQGEKTTKPFSYTFKMNSKISSKTAKLPIVEAIGMGFGDLKAKPKAFLAHGRLSTNEVKIDNTHPFYNGSVALAHNGVVQDATGIVKDLTTTCDTEILLKLWERGGMADIETNTSGYYAIMVLDNKGKLHIARDDRAMLYIAYSISIDAYITATTIEIIEQVAKAFKWTIDPIEEVKENQYFVFDRNNLEHYRAIDPIGYASNWGAYGTDAKVQAALGGNDDAYEGYSGVSPKDEYAYDRYSADGYQDCPVWAEESETDDDAITPADVVSLMARAKS